MEWRFYGPLLLAVLMFLLVGTIIERRLEVAIRRLMDQRQVMLQQDAEEINEVTSQTSTMTSSQRTPAPCRTQSTPVVNRQPQQDITVRT